METTKPKALLRLKIDMYDAKAFAIQIANQSVNEYTYTWELLRQLPEKKWVARMACYRVPVTGNNVSFLMDRFLMEEMELSDDAKVYFAYTKLTEQSATKRETRRWEYIFNGVVPEFKWNATGRKAEPMLPFKHQIVAADAMADAPFFGLLMEQGTGKTSVALNEMVRCALRNKAEGKPAFRALVICPRTLTGNWLKEAWKFLPEGLSAYVKRLPPNSNGAFELVEGMRSGTDLRIWIINPERVAGILDALKLMEFDLAVVDESNSIKNPKAKRTKAILELAESCKRRCIMTGTIMANSVLDVWSQFQFLQPGCLGYDSFYAFRTYFSDIRKVEGGWDKLVGYRHLEELKQRMSRFSFIVRKDQCLDLPPKAYVRVQVEMEENQQALYEEMLDMAIAHLDEENAMEAKAPISVLMRLAQITSGFIRTPLGETIRIPDGTAKAEAAMEIIRNAEGKVIVWCRFREDIRYLKERLAEEGIKSVVMHGGVSASKAVKTNEHGTVLTPRDIAVDSFNANNDVKVYISDPGTGGIGLTLLGPPEQRCRTMIYYSHEWSLAERAQSEDRAHRIGQDQKLTIYDLVCVNSVDERIVEALLAKRGLSEYLTDVSTIREFLLGGRALKRPKMGGKPDSTSTRHLLHSMSVTVPCELGQEEGCENYDHSLPECCVENQKSGRPPCCAPKGAELVACPHCSGDPLSVSVAALRRFMESGATLG